MNRRQILASLGAVSALSSCNTIAPASHNANQPVKSEHTPLSAVLGVQLYTLRDLFKADFRSTLKAVADIGYKDLEFAGYFDHKPSEVKAYMEDLGLVSNSSHVQLDDLRNNFPNLLQTAQVMGQTKLIIPWLRPEERNKEGYTQLSDLMNTRGKTARAEGILLAYHNHEFEFDTLDDGRTGYDILLNETDPEHVGMEIDFFWAHKADIDTLSYLTKHAGRFVSCHVKDATRSGEMVAVGEGVIDFDRLLPVAMKQGMQHFYVEHDNPANALVSIRESFQNLTA